MKIIPLKHSGVLVVTDRRAFLFDYIGGELPAFAVPLTILVSHRHEDHYDERIFSLRADEILLASDIKTHEGATRIAPYETRTHEDYTLRTVKSTDEGVAFLLETEDARLFFAADLNDWYWEDEDSHEEMVRMEEAFRREIDRIERADLLFFPVDPRLKGAMTKGLDYAVRRLHPEAVLPIHTWGEDAKAEAAVKRTGVDVLTRKTPHTWRVKKNEEVSKNTNAPAPKILLTGFEPFDGETENPSGEIIRALKSEARDDLVTAILPVAFSRAATIVEEMIRIHRPDRVVLLGQAGGRNRVTAEWVAINFRDARIPDNDGKKPRRERILPDAPDAYFSTAPVHVRIDELLEKGIPAAVSLSAGTYVCNEIYFTALHAMAGRGETVFLHLPYLPGQATKKDAPSMELATMLRAVRHFL